MLRSIYLRARATVARTRPPSGRQLQAEIRAQQSRVLADTGLLPVQQEQLALALHTLADTVAGWSGSGAWDLAPDTAPIPLLIPEARHRAGARILTAAAVA